MERIARAKATGACADAGRMEEAMQLRGAQTLA